MRNVSYVGYLFGHSALSPKLLSSEMVSECSVEICFAGVAVGEAVMYVPCGISIVLCLNVDSRPIHEMPSILRGIIVCRACCCNFAAEGVHEARHLSGGESKEPCAFFKARCAIAHILGISLLARTRVSNNKRRIIYYH